MKRYERPALRALGRMDVVTRKSGAYPDVDEAGQPTSPQYPLLCQYLGWLFPELCLPAAGGSSAGQGAS